MTKILVIGETCIDKFIYCDVKRLSPEAPVPILHPKHTIQNNGMSGNVVENLKSLNSELDVTHWCQTEEITKTRYVEQKSNHIFLRIDEGENNIKRVNIDLLNDVNFIKSFDFVIVSDYDKGFLSHNDLIFIGKNSKLSILDTKKKINNEIISSFTFIKLNEEEFINNKEFKNSDNIICTLGSKGARNKNTIYPVLNPKQTIDVSGAGDTFTASFILKYYETNDISESISFANEKSSIVVSKRGVSTP